MDDTVLDTILVVSGREFSVNRKILIENSSYFRAMFEGGFKESTSDRVELKGVCDADAFAVLIEYILKKRVNLKEVVGILTAVLTLCDMLNLNEFLEFLKHELFKSWSDLETAESILLIAERLNVRASLWSHILGFILNTFKNMGNSHSNACAASIIDTSPDLVAEILGTEEESTLCFWDIEYEYIFVKNVISWVFDHQLPQQSIRNLVRCFGTLYRKQDELIKMIDEQQETRKQYIVKPEVHHFITEYKDYFRDSVYRLCAGVVCPNDITMYTFNPRAWKWNLIEFDTLHEHSSFQASKVRKTSTNHSVNSNVYFWYTSLYSITYHMRGYSGGADPNLPGESSSVYTSAEHASSGLYHLLIFELVKGTDSFSEIFRKEVPGPILGCELLRLDDVLHGFVTYKIENNLYNICHFVLHRKSEDDTWSNPDFRFEPLLSDIRLKFTPVATAISTMKILVLFRRHEHYLFLTEYRLDSGFLKPLAHIKTPSFATRSATKYKQFLHGNRELCTFNRTCCCDYRTLFFYLCSVPGRETGYSRTSFLYGFDKCANNEIHAPKLESVIHICESY